MKEAETVNEDISRVLLELSITEKGDVDVRIDEKLPPVMVLAVIATLDTLKDDLKNAVQFEGVE